MMMHAKERGEKGMSEILGRILWLIIIILSWILLPVFILLASVLRSITILLICIFLLLNNIIQAWKSQKIKYNTLLFLWILALRPVMKIEEDATIAIGDQLLISKESPFWRKDLYWDLKNRKTDKEGFVTFKNEIEVIDLIFPYFRFNTCLFLLAGNVFAHIFALWKFTR